MVVFVLSAPQIVTAGGIQRCVHAQPQGIKRMGMPHMDVLVDLLQADALHSADSVGKIGVDHRLFDADGLKNLSGLIRLQRRNAHLGCNFDHAAQDRFVVILNGHIQILIEHVVFDQFCNGFMGKIGVDRNRAIP